MCLAWDATCANTFAESHVLSAASTPGAAAREAEDKKRKKYSDLAQRFRFEPLSFETAGACGPSTKMFVRELGARMTSVSGDPRETAWLWQRLALAIVRGNAASILHAANVFDPLAIKPPDMTPKEAETATSGPAINPASVSVSDTPASRPVTKLISSPSISSMMKRDNDFRITLPKKKQDKKTDDILTRRTSHSPPPSSAADVSSLAAHQVALLSEPPLRRRRTVSSGSSTASTTTATERSPESGVVVQYGPQDGLTGLRNIGNTCFMNPVLQCLSNTRALHDYILSDGFTSEVNTTTSSMKGALIQAFADLIQDLWKKSDETEMVVTTALFKSQIQRFAPRFMGYQQQDAQEFLRYLLEGLHEDVNRVTSRPRPIIEDIGDNLSDSQKAKESWKRWMRFDNSKFVDLFVGQLKSTLRCTVCGHASVAFDPFWDLSLPIPAKTGQVRLQACFDLFTKEEVLDGDEKPTCAKCQKRQKCTKSFAIQKFPRILVVHLKRFSPQERGRCKLNSVVDFPLCGLDLSSYSEGQGPCKYSLYGVANHLGTLYSGHYTAYCRHPYSAEWREYNDGKIRTVSMGSVVSNEAYVLFFELANASSL